MGHFPIVIRKHLQSSRDREKMPENKTENEANVPVEKTSSLGEVRIGLSPKASLKVQQVNLIICGIWLACLSPVCSMDSITTIRCGDGWGPTYSCRCSW